MVELSIIAAYLICSVVIGIISSRKKKRTLKEQFVANGSLGVGMLLPLLFGELIAGASTTGTATTGFTDGAIALYALLGNCLGCIFAAIFLSKFFVNAGRSGAMTLSGIFSFRFDKRIRPVIIIIALVAAEVIFALQIKAAAVLISPLINVSSELIAWVVAGIFLLMALLGLKSVAGMNIVHSCVLFVGLLIVCIFCVNSIGGLGTLAEKLPESYFSLTSTGYGQMLAKLGGTVLSFGIAAAPVNICFAADSVKSARISLIVGALIGIVFAFIPLIIGMCGQVVMPGANANSILFLMPNSISPWLSLLSTLAVMAAVFSTGPFLLLYLCTLATKDIAQTFAKKNSDNEKYMYALSKAIAIPFAVIAVLFANRSAGILTDLLGVAQMQAMCTITLLAGMVWRKATTKGAICAILVSGIVTIIWHFLGEPFGIVPFFVGLPINLALLFVVSLATCKGKESASYRKYKEWQKNGGVSDESLIEDQQQKLDQNPTLVS